MENAITVYVCSEVADFRGFFVKDPSVQNKCKVLGYIQNQKGDKTFVKDDEISRDLLESKSEYNFIKFNKLEGKHLQTLIEIKEFITVSDADSSGNIVCGF